jgi:hypothetical protein
MFHLLFPIHSGLVAGFASASLSELAVPIAELTIYHHSVICYGFHFIFQIPFGFLFYLCLGLYF